MLREEEIPTVERCIHDDFTELITPLGYKVFFMQKPEGYRADNYVTFNYTIAPTWHSEMGSEMELYNVVFNVISETPPLTYEMTKKVRGALLGVETYANVTKDHTFFDKDLQRFITVITFNTLY